MQGSWRGRPPTELGGADVEPFELFYRREYTRMVAIARALTRSGSAAEDLAQESFVAAHRHWDRVSTFDDPGAWVRRVLINRATSWHRKVGAELRAVTRLKARNGAPDLLVAVRLRLRLLGEIPPADMEPLRSIYTEEELEMTAEFGNYALWRLSIDQSGAWTTFIAGDRRTAGRMPPL